jgi:hypothetical protein
VSYSRNDAPAYPPSPAVEQSVAVPVTLSHPEAMDRFSVGDPSTFDMTPAEVVPEFGEGSRGRAKSITNAIFSRPPSES